MAGQSWCNYGDTGPHPPLRCVLPGPAGGSDSMSLAWVTPLIPGYMGAPPPPLPTPHPSSSHPHHSHPIAPGLSHRHSKLNLARLSSRSLPSRYNKDLFPLQSSSLGQKWGQSFAQDKNLQVVLSDSSLTPYPTCSRSCWLCLQTVS